MKNKAEPADLPGSACVTGLRPTLPKPPRLAAAPLPTLRATKSTPPKNEPPASLFVTPPSGYGTGGSHRPRQQQRSRSHHGVFLIAFATAAADRASEIPGRFLGRAPYGAFLTWRHSRARKETTNLEAPPPPRKTVAELPQIILFSS